MRASTWAADDRAGAKLLNFAAMGDDASSGVVIEARAPRSASVSGSILAESGMTCQQHFENNGTHVASRSSP
jgi:hypothetical protein